MAEKKTSKQMILFMIICALSIMLMAISFMDKEWFLFGLAFISFVSNAILTREFWKKNKK